MTALVWIVSSIAAVWLVGYIQYRRSGGAR